MSADIKNKLKKGEIPIENNILKISELLLKEKKMNDKILDEAGKCDKCGKDFSVKKGRFGKFLACSGYPDCKNIKNIKKGKK